MIKKEENLINGENIFISNELLNIINKKSLMMIVWIAMWWEKMDN